MIRSGRNSARRFAYGVRHRFLSLALLALLVQATLPYLLTNCPFYAQAGASQSSISATHTVMPADCPMLEMHHAIVPQPGPHKTDMQASLHCPLCTVLSPLHSFVVAGLIALPPPPAQFAKSAFSVSVTYLESQPRTAAFSARAPPAIG